MYARYIPPPAEPRATVGTPGTSNVSGNEQEPSSKRKRLVKVSGSSSKRQKQSKTGEEQVESTHTRLSERDSKRQTKSKRRSVQVDATADQLKTAPNGKHDENKPPGTNDPKHTKSEESHNSDREARKSLRKAAREAARNTLRGEGDDEDKPSRAHARILQKFEKSAQRPGDDDDNVQEHEVLEEPELRDLVPIPRPKASASAFAKPTFSALPSWLSEPIIVPSEQRSEFKELGIESALLSLLAAEGFESPLPVQSGVLPLLLPAPRQHPGDVCVSAATGSGKTIAYVLPIIQSLRKRVETRLRALLVVPTRELVSQVRKVADAFANGTNLTIGTAVGSQNLKAEQENLVYRTNRYDPAGWQELRQLLHAPADDFSHWDDPEHQARVEEALATLPSHVPEYHSKVDILICTPGRLVDHINNTRGFTLGDLEWLVVDEADRLLDQSFQEWSNTVNSALSKPHARDLQRSSRAGQLDGRPSFRRGVRKVMLSATMTNDLTQLDALKLQNPKLVVVGSINDGTVNGEAQDGQAKATVSATMLPPTLEEHAVPVGSGTDKPLYVLQLLDSVFGRSSEFSNGNGTSPAKSQCRDDWDDDSSSVVSSDSDSSSAVSSLSSNSDDGTASSASPRSISSSSSSASESTPAFENTGQQNALIFTSTNEAALRLSSLLGRLSINFPRPYRIATVTKSSKASTTRAALQAFGSGSLDILIASDRIARGLDLPSLMTVINYDVPRSTTSYVHRAGRTARAGRRGTVWTLLENHEARWFWKEIGGIDAKLARPSGGVVQRTNLAGEQGWSELARKAYGEALERLKKDVLG